MPDGLRRHSNPRTALDLYASGRRHLSRREREALATQLWDDDADASDEPDAASRVHYG